jgi:D-hexose-6-phosphate mutarotase
MRLKVIKNNRKAVHGGAPIIPVFGRLKQEDHEF